MFGVIITGHGTFAEGMESAVRLLAGENQAIRAVNFMPDQSEEDYREMLSACLESMKGFERILILCDILGGTPFKTAYLLRRDREQTEIFYGVNLPLVLEICMQVISGSGNIPVPGELAEAGKQSVGYIEKP